MPNVNPGESEDDFITRCIPMVINEGTTDDPKTAAAICYSKWREKASAMSDDDVIMKIKELIRDYEERNQTE